MAIKRMISRDVEEFREFQTRMVEVGRIRTGEYVVPEGKRGRPVKLDRFRLTSLNEGYIRAAAEEYGGEVKQYQPQGGGPKQWEVVTITDALYVYIVNGQLIDPVYEAWGGGRTCVRRCDGEWNSVLQEPCICNDPAKRPPVKELCKVTTRVNVMLPRVAGLNSWRLETHSENAAVEMAAPNVAGLVRAAPMPVPASLYLRKEQRRERNHEKQTFETKDFYVPTFGITVVSAEQLVGGRQAFADALTAGAAPALLAAPDVRQAIEAAPVSAPVPPSTVRVTVDVRGADSIPGAVTDELRARILAKIEAQTTLDGLADVQAKLKEQGITDRTVIDAWKSKRAAVEADYELQSKGGELEPGDFRVEYLDEEPPFTDPADDLVQRAEAVLPPEKAAELRDIVEGRVETIAVGTGVMPDVPAGDYDTDEQYLILMSGAGHQDPPLTTREVNNLIIRSWGLNAPQEASGLMLARLIAGLKAGTVQWRV